MVELLNIDSFSGRISQPFSPHKQRVYTKFTISLHRAHTWRTLSAQVDTGSLQKMAVRAAWAIGKIKKLKLNRRRGFWSTAICRRFGTGRHVSQWESAVMPAHCYELCQVPPKDFPFCFLLKVVFWFSFP